MIIIALLAGLLSGIIGAMGMGGGAVLIIYLTLFTATEQIAAQGINLIFFIPIGITALIIYSKKKQIKWKTTLPIAFGGLIGTVVGIVLGDFLGSSIISKIFGGFLIILGIIEVFKKNKEKKIQTTLERK